ncbi:unnamed protein product [Boreogadus saida]
MASATSWSEENFSCSICLDVYDSPVTTACGHNFCRTCITKLKAVKSCLMCLISYCQTHLEPHQRVAGLKKHRLVEPMDRLEERMCKKHNQLLELFCQTEQVSVCQFCTEDDHKSHAVVPLKEEYEVKTAQLGKIEAEVPQMIQERKLKIQEIKEADRQIADVGHLLTALISYVEKWRDDFNQMNKEKRKSSEIKTEDLVKELEQEIEDLTNRSSEVKRLSHTKDYLHFLQAFRSLKDPPPTRDWTTVEVHSLSSVGTLRRSLNQLVETLDMEMKKLRDDVELKRVQQYAVDVTLDPDTAHTRLILSRDGKRVHVGGLKKTLLDSLKRFEHVFCVVTRQRFSSGRFYFEVQVKDKTTWCLGVARASISRTCVVFSTETGCWTLYYDKDGLVFRDHPNIRLPLRAELQKVGVFVDYDEGLVSFYDVEARVHLYSATGCTFSGPLCPLLRLYSRNGRTNSTPLIISPVNKIV